MGRRAWGSLCCFDRLGADRVRVEPRYAEKRDFGVLSGDILHVGLPTIAGSAVQDDRPRGVLDQETLDVPDDLLALLLVELARLR